jgi:DNA-binding NtrC family response regulator
MSLPPERDSVEIPSWRRLLIGDSPAIRQICRVIELIASKRCTVLISGETGTGKEVIAKTVHAASNRSALPMVSVNCTALPASLIESELFGHAKGAFTGAYMSRMGRFEQAHRSTIFLDEIGDLPLDAQAKLLRVLQEQEFQRVGSSETVRVDVRVIAASNVDLEKAMKERRFREDLFYRLNVVPIQLPPLRERPEDIPLLLGHFLAKISNAENVPLKEISSEAADLLCRQKWPGNVRQLEHTVQMAMALSGNRPVLQAEDFAILGKQLTAGEAAQVAVRPLIKVSVEGLDFDDVVGKFELSLLNQALALSGGNKARAADLLRIKRTTLLAKLKTFEERSGDTSSQAATAAAQPLASCFGVALVVETDPSIRSMVAKTLENETYRVLSASNARSAVELCNCWKTRINLLVIANDMGGSAGIELLEQLRSVIPSVPAILTSVDSRALAFSARHTSVTYLSSPFSPEDLVEAAKQAIVEECAPAAIGCA